MGSGRRMYAGSTAQLRSARRLVFAEHARDLAEGGERGSLGPGVDPQSALSIGVAGIEGVPLERAVSELEVGRGRCLASTWTAADSMSSSRLAHNREP